MSDDDYRPPTAPTPGHTLAVCETPNDPDVAITVRAHENEHDGQATFEVYRDGDEVASLTVDELVALVEGKDLPKLADRIAETTAARGADTYAVEDRGKSAAEWAEITDRNRSTVARNVRRATDGGEQ